MRNAFIAAVLVAVLVLTGCAKVVGPYYLEQEKYEDGIEHLGEQLRENPDDSSSAYYVGRYYLGLEKPEQGLHYLERAAELDPDNADYLFWTGVAHWALFDFEKEREAYLKALALEPEHVSANLYLGHGYTDRGEWPKALAQYDKVLKRDKYNPEALFNRAAALSGLGRKMEEIAAWKKFLEFYPDGSLAMQATERLNLHGDFTYRNFILGQRNVTLKSMAFKPGTSMLDAASKDSLHVLGAMLKTNRNLAFHIVAYARGDAVLAKDRAEAVRDYMLRNHYGFDLKRLPLSWFGTAELIEVGERKYPLDDSVQFITVVR